MNFLKYYQQKKKKKIARRENKCLTIRCKYSSLVIGRSELIRTDPLLQLAPLRSVNLKEKESPLLSAPKITRRLT